MEVLVGQAGGVGSDSSLGVAALANPGLSGQGIGEILKVCQPRVILYLDQESERSSPRKATNPTPISIHNPYHLDQSYRGWWSSEPDGVILGKAPQHPAAHRLYSKDSLTTFLAALPV